MSGLSDRIRAIVNPFPQPGEQTVVAQPFRAAGGTDAAAIDEVLGGAWRDSCYVVDREWTRGASYGRERIGDLAERLDAGMENAALFAGGPVTRPPLVFFDLETTGLNGGAGTHVFLIGCGRFEDGRFVTRQFVLTRFADERPMLQTVAGELGGAGAIVSFNGKSFDAPLLETRYLFHRMAWIGAALPHIDVLHPARQFWKRDDCSLSALEHHLVGHRRVRDVPGIEIPARYFQFVRTGDARPLAAVLEHNRHDLLSLAVLTTRLLTLARSGPPAAATGREALALGRVYVKAGLEGRACEAFERAIVLCRAPAGAFDAVTIEALRALALSRRRMREFDEAARCWQALLDIRGCPPPIAREANEALAIHHEHRRRDFAAAHGFATLSLENAEIGKKSGMRDWTPALKHRLGRLERKLTATQQQSSLPWRPSSAVRPSARRTSS